jgi:hypothetical protein
LIFKLAWGAGSLIQSAFQCKIVRLDNDDDDNDDDDDDNNTSSIEAV